MPKHLRIMCNGHDGSVESSSMTSITVRFEDNETDFESAKAKALGYIVQELSRYGLHEALGGIGIRPAEEVWIDGKKWVRASPLREPSNTPSNTKRINGWLYVPADCG